MKDKKNLDVLLSFRIDGETGLELKKLIEKSNKKPSAVIRELVTKSLQLTNFTNAAAN
jgi:hypothetical protein